MKHQKPFEYEVYRKSDMVLFGIIASALTILVLTLIFVEPDVEAIGTVVYEAIN